PLGAPARASRASGRLSVGTAGRERAGQSVVRVARQTRDLSAPRHIRNSVVDSLRYDGTCLRPDLLGLGRAWAQLRDRGLSRAARAQSGLEPGFLRSPSDNRGPGAVGPAGGGSD